ncbi:MAG: PKD domain-containing protein, partial [Anaerolineae bacterium]
MIKFKQRPLIGVGIVLLVGVMAMAAFGTILRGVSASPLRQLPNPVVVTGDLSEVSLLSGSIMDPDPLWRTPTFDDSGWQASYLAATLPAWGAPVGVDFIWGGLPGADVGGRYEIPTNPAPQYLFLRDNFCIPINADVASIQPSVLQMQVVASPGDASINYNGTDLGSLSGREDGFVYNVNMDPAQVASVRRVGRNTLAISAYDNVADARAAIAYHIEFSYAIDPAAITLLPPNPPSGAAYIGTPVTFSYGGTGAGGDSPYAFGWDFGDGTTSTDPNPTIAYTAVGTYTVTLVIADRFGCSSEPVSMQYVVVVPPTPTPTNT